MQIYKQAIKSLSFVFFIVQPLIFSCTSNTDSYIETQLSYAIDTVLIDSKDEILFLQRQLYTSDYSEYDGMLYNLNDRTNQVEHINLKNLLLEKTIQYEQEGPNGTGFWTSDLQAVSDQQLFLGGERAGIYNLKGELEHRFDWYSVTKERGGILEEERVFFQVVNPNFHHQVFAVVVHDFANSISLRRLKSSSDSIQSYNIDPQEHYLNYTLGDLKNFNKWDPMVYIKSINAQVIVSHEFANDFYVLYPEKDSLIAINYDSPFLLSKVIPTTEGDLVNSMEDRKKALRNYRSQVVYGPIVFDTKNRHYVRLAASIQYGEVEREGYLLPEIDHSMLYISIFDKNFNHLGDQEIPELNRTGIPKYFIRDGAIWMFINVDDELGFIRIKLS
ncbi:hypothetical protein Belba_3652 [Belliella baltica DSM 15883]|uniref:DUF4221 domain-containing protein n=1 Tax=Belliella baltica (strain DSM 15883 / CIP 108006 / LMG 21964 / BA134) TaxID=866536 RepID=I3ZA76_BELBD|nr:DUF4221 family protein [Belliella baltica]AFL86144.1 hypothetical protein Belba_3652 [Belliella baltica DSM 15883]